MDSRDSKTHYAQRKQSADRKVVRLTRRQQSVETTKNIIITAIALGVTFVMVTVMITQLAS